MSFEQSAEEHDRKLLTPFDGRQLDPVGETQGIDGELKVGIRRCIMTALDQMEVIVDPFGVNFGRKFIEVDRLFGQMSGIVRKGAFAFAGNNNFLFKLGKQFGKICYIGTGSLEEVFFFFMIDIRLRMNEKVTSFWLLLKLPKV